jgi:putative ABC transport system permease protein
VVRYLLAESGVLATCAAAAGIALAYWGVRLLRDFGAGYFPRTHEIALDGPVWWALVGLTAASALVFGLLPAMHGAGGPVDESLRSTGRSFTGSVSVRRLRRVLVGCQFAIATPLLVVAGLLLGSLNALGRVDLGFDTRNLLSGQLTLPQAQYAEPGQVTSFWDELQRRVEALPGVSSVAFTDGRPPNEVNNHNNFDLEEFPTPPGESQPVTPWLAVTPEFFKLFGLTTLEGRLLDERDGRTEAIEAVVVDRAWAKRFFPNDSAVGKRFREGGCTTCPWTTVVGVVSEVKYDGLDKPDNGTVYWAMPGRGSQSPARWRYMVLRATTDSMTVLPAVRQVVRDLDPSLPFSTVATMDELVARSLQRPRSLSLLVGGLAMVALVLSIVGIYGVMAYYVQQHLKDITIRLALGGTTGAVLRLIVGQGMAVAAAGVAFGLLAALLLARLMSSLLFGVGAADAFTLITAATLLMAVAALACFVPARRASRLQPAVVLRND